MNTRRGKGYFYALGAREANGCSVLVLNKMWPNWAKQAYSAGFFGRAL